MFRILVTGSRKYEDRRRVWDALDKIVRWAGVPLSEVVVIEGGAVGADRYAREWAIFNNVAFETYNAKWSEYGASAGPRRNTEMVKTGADICLAFPLEDSIGTIDCIGKAKRAGILVVEY